MSKFLKYPLRFLNGLLDRIIAVLGVVSMAQFPQFFAQYLQRLGGHLAEAKFILLRYQLSADYFDLSLDEYISLHVNSGNEIFSSSGQVIAELVDRVAALEGSFTALNGATPFNRWWVFLQEVDLEMLRETWSIFTPGIPTTIEGAIYGFLGLILAWGVYHGIKTLFKSLYKLISSLLFRGKSSGIPA